jgi:hypothetical protein
VEKELLEFLADHPNSREAHERAQEVHAIRALDLERDLRADLEVFVSVD